MVQVFYPARIGIFTTAQRYYFYKLFIISLPETVFLFCGVQSTR